MPSSLKPVAAAGLIVYAVCCSLASPLQAAAPTLTHLFPAGGQRGTTVSVKCAGKFDWPVQVWAPGVEVSVGEESGVLQVTLPEELATDRVWLRLYNAEGTSAVRPLLVGALAELNEEEPNDSPADAQVLSSDRTTVNGVLQKRGDVDGFALKLVKGQTLVASVDANDDLGSPIDAMLQIATPEGVVLAEQHDDVGLDPRLAFVAPTDGTYVARIFAFPATPNTSIAYHGGADCIYRLTLTTGPFITHAAPLAVPIDGSRMVAPRGFNIQPGTELPVVPLGVGEQQPSVEAEMWADGRQPVGSQTGFVFAKGFAGSARVLLIPEGVADDAVAAATDAPLELQPPFSLTGCLDESNREDVIRMPLSKGQQVVVSVESRGLELPLHPVVKIVDLAGKSIAKSEPRYAEDILIRQAIPRDDSYEVRISDLYRQAGPRCMYRLSVHLDEADFELTAGSDAIVAATDKPAELTINVKRRKTPGSEIGPITIEAVNLPPGVNAPVVTSEPKGDSAAKVTLALTTDGQAFSGPIRIVGRTAEPRMLERETLTSETFGARFSTIWLTVAPKQ